MNQRSNHEDDFYIYPPHDVTTGKRVTAVENTNQKNI
jgi:hypothetical protein